MEEFRVREEERCIPTKKHEAGNAARLRIALDVVVTANPINSAEHGVVRPPAVPQKFNDRRDNRNADSGNHSECGNPDEAEERQPEFPLLNAENTTQVGEFEQPNGG